MIQNTLRKLQKQEMFRIRKGATITTRFISRQNTRDRLVGRKERERLLFIERKRRPISGGERRSGPMRIKRTAGKEWNSWMEKRTSGGNKGEQRDRSFWPP